VGSDSSEAEATPEVRAVSEFLACCVPFDALDPGLRQRAATQLRIVYGRAGERLADGAALSLVRAGALELRSVDGELQDRCGAGDSFGPSLGTAVDSRVHLLEDTLLYRFDVDTVAHLRQHSSAFAAFCQWRAGERLRVSETPQAQSASAARAVHTLMSRDPLTCSGETTVMEAARQMSARHVSALPVCGAGGLLGIVTDRDLRTRVLAQGLPGDTPIARIMTPEPLVIDANASAFEAMLLMSEHGVHHLPVTVQGRLGGMLSSSDLLRAESSHPLRISRYIERAAEPSALAGLPARIRDMLLQSWPSGLRAVAAGRVLAVLADAATRQLLQIAERELGPAPLPYAWLALGSQGRQEQALGGDQDNALLLAEAPDASAAAYFSALALRVCEGLATAGYPRCHGEVMACNPRWCQPLSEWKRIFARWIDTPTPEALMHASVFFDMRCVAGQAALADELRDFFLQRASDNGIFIACLCQNALTHRPPLGFFRNFVLERSGEHIDTIDLKHRGLAPLVDIGRLRALAAGVAGNGTLERLEALASRDAMAAVDAAALGDAYRHIADVRLGHQLRQIERGEPAHSHLVPAELSALGQAQLRQAFQAVRAAQNALQLQYARRF
jgi:CBS domain-containing protein